MRKAYRQDTYRRVQTKGHKVQIGILSPTATGLIPIFRELTLKQLLPFKVTYMLLLEYPSIIGGDLPDYSKKSRWNLSHAYIDAHSQRLFDEYPGDGL